MSGVPRVQLPHPVAGTGAENMTAVADSVAEQILNALEASSDCILSARDEEAALEELHRLRCTDGLPVVIPTAERVSRMVRFRA